MNNGIWEKGDVVSLIFLLLYAIILIVALKKLELKR